MRHLRGQLSSNGRYPVPMPSIRHLLATLLACILPFALAACVSTPPPASPASAAVRTPLVLVSIDGFRSEEHTSELQSLMRISYAVFCLKKKIIISPTTSTANTHQSPHHRTI